MASTCEHHHKLTDGVGKCSVPMWCMGVPDGFCDKPAYGERPPSAQWFNYAAGRMMREDCKYDGHVPGLACEGHGGPSAKRTTPLQESAPAASSSSPTVTSAPTRSPTTTQEDQK